MPIARAERVLSQRSALWRRTGEARKQVLLRRRRYAQGLQVSRGSHEREEVSFAPTSFCSVARGCLHVRSQKYRYLPIEWNVGGPLLEVQAKRGTFCCWSLLLELSSSVCAQGTRRRQHTAARLHLVPPAHETPTVTAPLILCGHPPTEETSTRTENSVEALTALGKQTTGQGCQQGRPVATRAASPY